MRSSRPPRRHQIQSTQRSAGRNIDIPFTLVFRACQRVAVLPELMAENMQQLFAHDVLFFIRERWVHRQRDYLPGCRLRLREVARLSTKVRVSLHSVNRPGIADIDHDVALGKCLYDPVPRRVPDDIQVIGMEVAGTRCGKYEPAVPERRIVARGELAPSGYVRVQPR